MARVRRGLAYLLVWGLGTAATVGACWLGLRSVLDATTPQRASPFSAAELSRPSPSPMVDESPVVVGPAEAGGTPTGAPVSTATTSAGTGVSATPVPTAAQTATPDNVASAAQAVIVPSVWEPVAGARITTFRRTFVLQGGELTFECNAFDVDLVRYVPLPGYRIELTRYSTRSLLISLLSNERASRVYVSWRDGPYAEITETVG